MAYHLQSLVRVIELILCHETQQKYFDNDTTPQLQSLLEKACSLRDCFADHATLSQQDSFEDQVRDATQNAEDVLETYVSLFSTENAIPPPDMSNLLESLDSVEKEMMKILNGDPAVSVDKALSPPVVASSSTIIDQHAENIVVGVTDDLRQLMDRLTSDSSKQEIIPIVGMGGIGKTTLARKIYGDKSVVNHFDLRAWSTVSDDYSLRDIVLGLLDQKNDAMPGVDDKGELIRTLYQRLKGRRYLIVLDDIWRSNAWDDVKMCFPEDHTGSRIILTTRQSHVATYVDSKSLHHRVQPLKPDVSWELLRKKVFGEEICPPELVELGMKISNSCGGVPLAIQVIGGLLSHTERTPNSWAQVAGNVVTAMANEDDEKVSGILALSYKNLPSYLKPCFLYMSAFPEDFRISPSILSRMWIAEGFLIPIPGKSDEEVAVEYLNALIDRNLIFVQRQTLRSGVESLGIHDLLRDLCVRKAREKKFFHVVNAGTDHNNDASQEMSCLRRVSILRSSSGEDIYGSTKEKQLARSLVVLDDEENEIVPHDFLTLRLLSGFKVDNLEAIIQVVTTLRYLSLKGRGLELDLRITTFRNLQFLIFNNQFDPIKVPQEVFEMPQLREISSPLSVLWCDFMESSSSKNDLVLQENLHTLPYLEITANIDVVLAKLPNLKEVGLFYTDISHQTVPPMSCLKNIEKLSFRGEDVTGKKLCMYYVFDWSFSNRLKSVQFGNLKLPTAFMIRLSMLPNLEVLTLSNILFGDTEEVNWKLSEEEKFCRLKYLGLSDLEMVVWEADETHFPRLEHLEIRWCSYLAQFPSGFGEISTLKKVEVWYSSSAAVKWARNIEKDQLDYYGNDLFEVVIKSNNKAFVSLKKGKKIGEIRRNKILIQRLWKIGEKKKK